MSRPKINKSASNTKKIWKSILIAFLIILLVIGGTLLLVDKVSQDELSEEELNAYQQNMLQQLQDRKGEYNQQSIILSDTSRSVAKNLAKKLDAELRITSNGSFATLYLPDEVTILDVCKNEEYLKDLPRMSIDFFAQISETVIEEESDDGLPVVARPQYTVSDASYELQTYLDYINLKNTWGYTKGKNVTVAVIDTGIDTDHPEFEGRISEYSYNASEDKIVKDHVLENGSYDWSLIEDEQGHGTSVAGVIASSMESGEIVGIAPEVTLLVIKVNCNEAGEFTNTSDLVFGLYYAIERDAEVVNMSFGTKCEEAANPFKGATQLAYDSDIICVAAAGNEASAELIFPAADKNVIGVGALEDGGWELASYSSYGENVDMVAPGTTFTTMNGGYYGTTEGTSLAAPTVSASIALLRSYEYDRLESKDITEILYASCFDLGDLGKDSYFGYGALDVSALILERRGRVTFNMMSDELDNVEQVFIREHTLQTIPEPERLYAVFEGWYYDPQCTEEYNWYVDKFSTDLTLYANWVNEEDGVPYTYVELDDGTIEIRSYRGHRRYITIPEYIDGKPVSSIGIGAFENEVRLREVKLPSTLVRIRDRAFSGCSNLINITVPDSVIEIGEKAFYDNIRLSSVTFGNESRLSDIGELAFSGCSKLRSFSVPAGVERLGESAFYRDTAMIFFEVKEGNTHYRAIDGALCSPDGTRLICYPYGKTSKAVIPESVTTVGSYGFRYARCQGIDFSNTEVIEEYAFFQSRIKGDLVLPDNITSIGGYSFANNYFILTLTFGNGFEKIPEYAFASCTAIDDINFSDSITTIGAYAFESCVSLPEVNLNESIVEIEKCAFFRCFEVQYLNFAENGELRSIGGAAFLFNDIKTLDFPRSLECIAEEAFRMNVYLESVTFAMDGNLREIGGYAFCDLIYITSLELPESLEKIGECAFSNTFVSEISIPKNLSSLAGNAFSSCRYLTAIEVSEENPYYNSIDGAVYSEDGSVFVSYPSGNTTLEYEVLSGVKRIGVGAFMGSVYLKDVSIPDGTEAIGASSFEASNVFYVRIGSGLNTIDARAFAMAKNLRSVNLPEGLEKVGQFAFLNTDSLNSLTIPESITVLEQFSFYGAGARYYVLPVTLTRIEGYSLAENRYLSSLNIPDRVEYIGKGAFLENWNMERVNISENTSLTRIAYGAFSSCGLTSFNVPANISTMAQGAFAGCYNLKTITFSENSKIESISAYMFNGCTGLQNISFGNGSELSSIQAHGFEGMLSIKSVDLSNTKLKEIDNFAFRFCENLTELSIPEGVENIGRFAFYGCSSLKDISIPSSVEHIGRFAFIDAKNVSLYFASETLPLYLDEDWDYDVKGYYLGVTEVKEEGDWRYALLTSGDVALIDYYGDDTAIDLSSLELGGSIVNIGGEVFANSALEEIILPSSLVTIQNEAFYNSKLKAVTIPESVTFIGRSAFADTPIGSLIFAGVPQIKVVEQSAFENTSKLSAVILPSSIETLGRAVFKNSGIVSLSFGENSAITEISEEAFAYTSITSLDLPNGIELIDHGAFKATKSLKSVSFGTEEFLVNSNAFYQSGLETLVIPENMTYIGEYAFVALFRLSAFEVDIDNPYYSEIDGLLVGSNGKKLISVPAGKTGSLTLPECIEVIGFGAFEETQLSEVRFSPDANILSLGYRAFYGAKNITSIHIPASVVAIDYYAFANCSNLETVTFAENSGLNGIYEGAFYGCGKLSNIVLPDEIVEISDFAFYGCINIKRIPISEGSELKGIYGYAMAYTGISGEFVLPETLTDIGEYAFLGTKMTSVVIPDTNAWDLMIGIGAFEDCNNIEEMTIPFVGASFESLENSWFGYIFGAGGAEASSVYVPEKLKKITVSDGITEIGKKAFSYLSAVEEIILPHSIVLVREDAFLYTDARYTLTNDICGETDALGYPEYVIQNGMFGKGFYGHLKIADGIKKIDTGAFKGFESITGITFGDDVEEIAWSAFEDCTALKDINFGKSVRSIGHGAFWGCTGIKELVLPDSLTELNDWGFYDCENIESLYIGSALSSFSFSGDKLVNIVISEDNPYFCVIDGIVYDKPVSEIIFVPRTLTGKLIIPEGVTEIAFQQFRERDITEVVLPDSLTVIGEQAFFGCRGLIRVTLGRGLERIENDAFTDGGMLYEIYNNSSLTLDLGNYETHGGIAYNAKLIVNADGTKNYRDSASGFEIFKTADGFMFTRESGEYYLISYTGNDRVIILPEAVNGNEYSVRTIVSNAEEIRISNGVKEFKFGSVHRMLNLKRFSLSDDNLRFSVIDGVLYNFECTEILIVPFGIEGTVTVPGTVRYIKSEEFSRCASLVEVILGDGVESIGSGAFSECKALKRVELPNTVNDFGISGVFSNCQSLEEIYLPDNIENIGGYTFYGCTSLKEVHLPKGLREINDAAFYECTSLTEVKIPEGIVNISNMAFPENTTLIFPDFITVKDGVVYNKSCTEILYINKNISGTVEILSGIKRIPDSAFYGCEGLEKIILPDTLEYIGCAAFRYCSALTEINIPDSVTQMDASTFYGCSDLKKVTLPSRLTAIGSEMFVGCSSLVEIVVPESVTDIYVSAFSYCSSLERINLPEGLTNIDYRAFFGCEALKTLELPSSLTTLDTTAFMSCPLLTLTVNDGNQHFKEIDGIIYNKSLTRIVYVSKMISGSIEVPEGIVSIGSSFTDCKYLTHITLPNSFTDPGVTSWSFENCSSLQAIIVSDEHTVYCSIDGVLYNKEKTKVIAAPEGISGTIDIPEGVTRLGSEFMNCGMMSAVVLPSTLTHIDVHAFVYCDSLWTIYNNTDMTFEFGSTNNGWIAYRAKLIVDKNGNKIYIDSINDFEVIETPDGFRYFRENGEYLLVAYTGTEKTVTLPLDFNGEAYRLNRFNGAVHVILPEGMSEVPEYAFCNDSFMWSSLLEKVTLPSTIKKIGPCAFKNCANLKEIELPEGLEIICNDAFWNCQALESISFPSTLKELGDSAFLGCESLENIVIPSTLESIGQGVFIYCYNLKTVSLPEGMTYIPNSIFSYCRSITEIRIPSTVQIIGDRAFGYCEGLTELVIPDSVTEIGYKAFSGCINLKTVKLSKALQALDGGAFSGCILLTEIELPDSLTFIGGGENFEYDPKSNDFGDGAFCNCVSLETIKIGKNVASIGKHAFYNTAFYNDESNWDNGILYLSKYLIRVSEDTKYFDFREDTYCIADGAYDKCYKLKIAYMKGESILALAETTNLETIVIYELPDRIFQYFGGGAEDIPSTLKNIVLKSGVVMNNTAFYLYNMPLSGYSIYVEDLKKDTMWDENYPSWQIDNRVFYGDKWITADFYEGELIRTKNLVLTSQIVRVPFTEDYISGVYRYVFLGYDTNGDGIPDIIPATSSTDIRAQAVYRKEFRCVKEGHVGKATCLACAVCEYCGADFGEIAEHCFEAKLVGDSYKFSDATCESPALYYKSCIWCAEAGDEYFEVGKKLSHDFGDWEVVTAPGCKTMGIGSRACADCGHTETKRLPPKGHTYDKMVVSSEYLYSDATCTSGAFYRYSCVCGQASQDSCFEQGERVPHEVEEWEIIMPPMCDSTGFKEGWCSSCRNNVYEDIPQTGHNYAINVVLPDCDDYGYSEHVCSNCGDRFVDSIVSALGHDYNVTVVEPGCETSGYTVHTCTACGSSYIDSGMSAIGHDYNATVVAPKCETSGYTLHTCANCGNSYMDSEVSALGHDYSTRVIAPKCNEGGYSEHRCNNCGNRYVDSVVPATGHNYIPNTIEPTCEVDGYNEYRCSNCGNRYFDSYVEATGHSYITRVVAPTCEKEGYNEYICAYCSDSYVDSEIPALGHDYITNVIVATCEINGYNEHICDTCGDRYFDSYVEATGHSFGEWQTVSAPTCNREGVMSRACGICGTVEKRNTDPIANAHKFVLKNTDKKYLKSPASCLESAVYYFSCECGTEGTETFLYGEPKGHSEAFKWQVNDTHHSKLCQRCGYEIQKEEHSFGEWFVDIPSTQENSGLKKRKCEICAHTQSEVLDKLPPDITGGEESGEVTSIETEAIKPTESTEVASSTNGTPEESSGSSGTGCTAYAKNGFILMPLLFAVCLSLSRKKRY